MLSVILEVCIRTVQAGCFYVAAASYTGELTYEKYKAFCSPEASQAAANAYARAYPEHVVKRFRCGFVPAFPNSHREA